MCSSLATWVTTTTAALYHAFCINRNYLFYSESADKNALYNTAGPCWHTNVRSYVSSYGQYREVVRFCVLRKCYFFFSFSLSPSSAISVDSWHFIRPDDVTDRRTTSGFSNAFLRLFPVLARVFSVHKSVHKRRDYGRFSRMAAATAPERHLTTKRTVHYRVFSLQTSANTGRGPRVWHITSTPPAGFVRFDDEWLKNRNPPKRKPPVWFPKYRNEWPQLLGFVRETTVGRTRGKSYNDNRNTSDSQRRPIRKGDEHWTDIRTRSAY